VAAMYHPALLLLAASLHLIPRGLAAEPLTKLAGCSIVPTTWSDGDSFLIRTGGGMERVALLLKLPFAVYTAFADARGDGRHQRIYGFVTLANGRDLASVLVEEGLARAFGVYRETPDLKSNGEYREAMRDLELQAAKLSRGIWAKTDWEKLPEERRQQRQEDADLDLAAEKKGAPKGLVLDPNTAARDELLKLPGVGEIIANRIIETRPYKTLEDLLEVPGIGSKTLEKLRPHLVIGEYAK